MALQNTGHIISITEVTPPPTLTPGTPVTTPSEPVAAVTVAIDPQPWQSPNPMPGMSSITFYTTLADAKNYSVGQDVTIPAPVAS